MNLFVKSARKIGFVAIALAATAGTVAPAYAVEQTGGKYNTLYAGLGIKGYDPVAYFTDGKPVEGKADISYDWSGVTWRFASAEHRKAFEAEPAKYAPQYGGFCSWGVSQGKLFDVDPVHAWKVVDGKLYMNFNSDIEAKWEHDSAGFISKANGNWPALNK
ncbi:MAG: YHS domain-containing protein [Nevskia sp.]|nr:YHS domain-containing protein [Nevskia sp.]